MEKSLYNSTMFAFRHHPLSSRLSRFARCNRSCETLGSAISGSSLARCALSVISACSRVRKSRDLSFRGTYCSLHRQSSRFLHHRSSRYHHRQSNRSLYGFYQQLVTNLDNWMPHLLLRCSLSCHHPINQSVLEEQTYRRHLTYPLPPDPIIR